MSSKIPDDLVQVTTFTVHDPGSVDWVLELSRAAVAAGLTPLGSTSHTFANGGVTAVVVLAESHAAVHTWPEYSVAWVELASCAGPLSLDQFERVLRDHLVEIVATRLTVEDT